MTKDSGVKARVTDEELMLFVDEELEGARYAEVAAFVLADVGARRKVAALRTAGSIVRESALACEIGDGIADNVMAKIEAETGHEVAPLLGKQEPKGKPSNDNARRIFAAFTIAAAAAAALLIWGKSANQQASTAPRTALVETAALPSPARSSEATTDAPKPEEASGGVEIAAVDFGTRTGTIFYVPSGAAAKSSMTAVVWVSDDGPGGL